MFFTAIDYKTLKDATVSVTGKCEDSNRVIRLFKISIEMQILVDGPLLTCFKKSIKSSLFRYCS